MTSENYSLNPFRFVFRRSFKKYVSFSVLMTLSGLIYMGEIFAVISSYHRSVELGNPMNYLKAEMLYTFVSDNAEIGSLICGVTWVVLGMLLGLFAFGFMLFRQTANIQYSLGISRTSQFAARYLAVAAVGLIGVFTPFMIITAANAAFFGFSKELLITGIYLFLTHYTAFMISFTFTAFAVVMSGNILEAVIYSAVMICSPFMVSRSVNAFISIMTRGAPVHNLPLGYLIANFSDTQGNLLLTSDSRLFNITGAVLPSLDSGVYFEMFRSEKYNMPPFGKAFVILFALILFLILTVYLNSRRKAEKSGIMGSASFMEGWSVVVIGSFLTSFVGSSFVTSQFSADAAKAVTVIAGLIIMSVGYTAADLIFTRSFKAYCRRIWHLPLEIGVFLVFVFITAGIMNFAYSRVPSAEKIESVSVSLPTQFAGFRSNPASASTKSGYLAINGMISDVSEDRVVFDGFSGEEEISLVTQVNNSLNTVKSRGSYQIYIEYKLKNGKTVKRFYTDANTDEMEQLLALLDTENFRKKTVEEIFTAKSVTASGITLVSPNASNTTLPASLNNSSRKKSELYKALKADILSGALSLRFDSSDDILGYIAFSPIDVSDDIYGGDESADVTAENDEEERVLVFSDYILIPVYAGMESTAEFLAGNNLLDYLKNKREFTEISFCSYDDDDYIHSASETGQLTAEIFSDRYEFTEYYADGTEISLSGELPESAVRVKEKDKLKEMSDKIRLTGFAPDAGCYVKAQYDDGYYLLAFIPES